MRANDDERFMDCTDARNHMLARRRGTLDEHVAKAVDNHLEGCASCREDNAADHELTVALEERLPARRAPDGLRRSIEAKIVATPSAAHPWRRSGPSRAPHLAMAAMAAMAAMGAIALAAVLHGTLSSVPSRGDAMVAEAVNDHLRVLYSEHPLEVESGGVHQVKPWFEGRVDFAPSVGFGGDDDFPLQGGAVAYFLDRKAAAYIFKRRLHVATLFVFRADGLPWPATSTGSLGRVNATERTTRGFHALLWHDGDLGYALVSDLDPRELRTLAGKIAGP